jgi:hypothetical protein
VTHADEQELRRLTGLLKSIDDRMDVDQHCREALQKAALALSVSFSHGLRPELENWHDSLGSPLSEDERRNLLRLGIDPDAGGSG